MVKFLSRHVDGADDKVQRRGILHQMLRPLKAHGSLSQFRSQPQGNAVAPLLLRLTELAADGVPAACAIVCRPSCEQVECT